MQSKSNQPFSIKKRISSFKYAFNGLKMLIKEEHNAKVHVIASIIVICLGVFCEISIKNWLLVFMAIALVFITELINSSIERIVDEISHEIKPQLGKIKDMSAAAVLVAAIVSIVIGGYVFIPYIIRLL